MKAKNAGTPVVRPRWSSVVVDVVDAVVAGALFLFGLALLFGGFMTMVFHTGGMSIGVDPLVEFFLGLIAVKVALPPSVGLSRSLTPIRRERA